MAGITISKAAELVGKTKQALYRKIESGELTVTLNHDRVKVVETSELLRVFGPFSPVDDSGLSVKAVAIVKPDSRNAGDSAVALATELGELRASKAHQAELIEVLKAQLMEARELAKEAREEAKEAREEAKEGRIQVMRLLEHKPDAASLNEKKKGKRSVIK